ncbi:hypothetical protein HX021_16110 [Sphingobacterium sp. N143]|uniref:hypothetical protein n=1 Tax=Sphingobacterium sp. N143 TaxID=2746727 RepID=UPI002576CCF2|nr:hypothetical protein [Sphingobacterium sp. N143]MDM1295814.1 hypothetical protein [Sphingobacterium sp. N143]
MQKISNNLKAFLVTLVLLNLVFIGIICYLLVFKSNETSLQRVDINNKAGANRVVISSEDHIPNPIINGKEYQRKMVPAGLLFYDNKGDERGGIAISEYEGMNFNAIAFDYQNADAIGLFAQDNLQTNYFKAGLTINDKDLSGKPGYNINRVNLETENGNATLVMKDANEIPRLVLKVDSAGNPSITMYDAKGKVTWKP